VPLLPPPSRSASSARHWFCRWRKRWGLRRGRLAPGSSSLGAAAKIERAILPPETRGAKARAARKPRRRSAENSSGGFVFGPRAQPAPRSALAARASYGHYAEGSISGRRAATTRPAVRAARFRRREARAKGKWVNAVESHASPERRLVWLNRDETSVPLRTENPRGSK
jgi:hypothetical protein